ncbi:LysE family translocator [Shewanella sp. GD03713]|uniref:LysE family translocator n=1 Tax=Shewanella sp. GD03713 TaxID=2975372 RepID=UPI000B34447E|nr:LysE family translocator [Shewanella sp. GD03713]MDH1469187.1 LysE family translocator [Shewanella sp. GD03713]QXN24253.1 LysE family translocator [Shewanella putrefaciens]
MELDSLLMFVIACLSINLIPGPDVVYIVSNTMKGKMASGLKAALGLGAGYFVHTLATCLGLSAIILSSALAFNIVKWLGAAYLLYLGVKALISCWQGQSRIVIGDNATPNTNVFLQGVVVSVLNPKVALFFLSFLPQFIDPASGEVATQLFILGLLFSGLATLVNLLYAACGSWLFNRADSKRYARGLEGVSGVLLVGLAGKVAISD